MNKVYNILVEIRNKKGYIEYSNHFYAYTLEEAIEKGKQKLFEYYTNFKPKFSKISFDDYMKKIDYCLFVYTISGNRNKFKSIKELKDYFENNISKISNDLLYDFLLSLIEYNYCAYDYKGNLLETIGFLPSFNETVVYNIEFTEDSCRNGKYIFRI